jgi:hypothetical protein
VNHFSTPLLIALAMQGAAALAVAADAPRAQAGGVLDDHTLICFCVIGSLGGALTSLILFGPNGDSTSSDATRRYAAKFASSFFSGVCVGPMAVERLGLAPNSTNAIGAGFLTSAFLIAALHMALPTLEAWWRRWLASKLPGGREPKEPPAEG